MEIAPGMKIEKVPFPEKPEFDFSLLEVGDSFLVKAANGKSARQMRTSIVQKAAKWARAEGKNVHFTSIEEDENYRIYMLAGQDRRRVSRKVRGI